MSRLGVLVLLAMAAGACTSLPFQADKVNVSLSDVRIAQVGVIEQQYTLKLRLQNPNAKELKIQGLSYEVELNGRNFARGVNQYSGSVPPFGEVMIDVSAVSSISTLIDQIAHMKQERPKAFRYRLSGKLNLQGTIPTGLPFDYAGEIAFSALAPSDEGLDQGVGK
jgi:LEA14-like dessication related protein